MNRHRMDWAPNILQCKTYDSDIGQGARIWSEVQLPLARRLPMEHGSAELRYGNPILVQPRLGQGGFYALEGSSVRMPLPPAPSPSAEYLEWHGHTMFRG